jgi:hypothetical protein
MMFSGHLHQRLKFGKYTKWSVNLTEPQLEVLLWVVGEFDVRRHVILDALREYKGEPFDRVMFARAKLALEALGDIACGKLSNLDEWRRRLHTSPELLAARQFLADENAGGG